MFQQFLNLSSSQRDMSGPILGDLSDNRWSAGICLFICSAVGKKKWYLLIMFFVRVFSLVSVDADELPRMPGRPDANFPHARREEADAGSRSVAGAARRRRRDARRFARPRPPVIVVVVVAPLLGRLGVRDDVIVNRRLGVDRQGIGRAARGVRARRADRDDRPLLADEDLRCHPPRAKSPPGIFVDEVRTMKNCPSFCFPLVVQFLFSPASYKIHGY